MIVETCFFIITIINLKIFKIYKLDTPFLFLSIFFVFIESEIDLSPLFLEYCYISFNYIFDIICIDLFPFILQLVDIFLIKFRRFSCAKVLELTNLVLIRESFFLSKCFVAVEKYNQLAQGLFNMPGGVEQTNSVLKFFVFLFFFPFYYT